MLSSNFSYEITTVVNILILCSKIVYLLFYELKCICVLHVLKCTEIQKNIYCILTYNTQIVLTFNIKTVVKKTLKLNVTILCFRRSHTITIRVSFPESLY